MSGWLAGRQNASKVGLVVLLYVEFLESNLLRNYGNLLRRKDARPVQGGLCPCTTVDPEMMAAKVKLRQLRVSTRFTIDRVNIPMFE